MRFWCKFGATLYATILTIFTISNGIVISSRPTMIALRQVMSYDWLRQVMSDCVALMGCGQSYHNYAKRIITFAKQTHNSKLKRSHLQIIQSQDG